MLYTRQEKPDLLAHVYNACLGGRGLGIKGLPKLQETLFPKKGGESWRCSSIGKVLAHLRSAHLILGSLLYNPGDIMHTIILELRS